MREHVRCEPHAARAFKQSVKGMAAKYKHHLPGLSGEEASREGTREPDGGRGHRHGSPAGVSIDGPRRESLP
jgi:hypothetical protein